jgi:hypothetical protein
MATFTVTLYRSEKIMQYLSSLLTIRQLRGGGNFKAVLFYHKLPIINGLNAKYLSPKSKPLLMVLGDFTLQL